MSGLSRRVKRAKTKDSHVNGHRKDVLTRAARREAVRQVTAMVAKMRENKSP